MPNNKKIVILGGGIAGLAMGYYARKLGRASFTVFEAAPEAGGNAITFQYRDFLFDSGAHRLHDQDHEITKDFKELLVENLQEIEIPSQIYYQGKMLDFPLSPLNLLKGIDLNTLARAILDFIWAQLWSSSKIRNFKEYSINRYGKTLANEFLLNYSKKLWGVPCDQLSKAIGDKRIKGLSIKNFIVETALKRKSQVKHLDGVFYYPKHGIGQLTSKLIAGCGLENIKPKCRATKLFHDQHRIQAVEINNADYVEADQFISSIPLSQMVEIMEPRPSRQAIEACQDLQYRNLLLLIFFVDKKSINSNGSNYFPNETFPFTRIYEPKNRSAQMAPPDKTSVVVELPCQKTDNYWKISNQELFKEVLPHLTRIGWFKEEEVLDFVVKRLPYAYPILTLESEQKVDTLKKYFKKFKNLKLAGRNGLFQYVHIHDLMREGKNWFSSRAIEESEA